MKYARPQIVRIYKAADAIQSIHAMKPGLHFDGTEAATSAAYEADE